MRFSPLAVPGSALIEPEPRTDERGSFARVWCAAELAEHGLDPALAQMNLSSNVAAGTLRGLHYQRGADAEAKLFRCIAGRTYHVMVDLRPASPTYLTWCGVELDATGYAAVYLPAGTAAGYQALEDGAAVLYSASRPYAPAAEGGLRWDDPLLGIDWPLADRALVSAKDSSWPLVDPTTPPAAVPGRLRVPAGTVGPTSGQAGLP